ncbi:cobyrinic acid a,c-diamide synthase [Streptomyces sp. AC1-42T]|nr:cobyrinic acid a,c-diamide synthase [Streptomyces sp. AC1-42T]
MLADAPRSAHLGRPAGPGVLVVGVGASRGVSGDEVTGLVLAVLREAGLPVCEVAELVTVEAKGGEPGIVAAAARLGIPLRTHPARVLARVAVPHPSPAALAALGTPSVAEAAALAGGGQLLVPKSVSHPSGGRRSMATCAVARRPVGTVA